MTKTFKASEEVLKLKWELLWTSCPYKKKELEMKIERLKITNSKETDEKVGV